MHAFTKLFVVLSSFEATITERRDERGVTAIEYALLAAGIAALVGIAALALGNRISAAFLTILP
ncbi:Flp family type IVb pilin [Aeromicrobium sp. CF3.5]|uniref:Flp family type IVb pilin n=1 Tax=Aeromicrobium sp. CF3.5 TaxID=3373078 RepID=UPI003EE7D252